MFLFCFLLIENFMFYSWKIKKNWKGSGEEGRGVGLDWGKGNGYVYSRGNLLILNDFVERGCFWFFFFYYNMLIELNFDLGYRVRL